MSAAKNQPVVVIDNGTGYGVIKLKSLKDTQKWVMLEMLFLNLLFHLKFV
jgi:hypothetical protein